MGSGVSKGQASIKAAINDPAEADRLFDALNKDHDKNVSIIEVYDAIKSYGDATQAYWNIPKMKETITRYDLNGDGQVRSEPPLNPTNKPMRLCLHARSDFLCPIRSRAKSSTRSSPTWRRRNTTRARAKRAKRARAIRSCSAAGPGRSSARLRPRRRRRRSRQVAVARLAMDRRLHLERWTLCSTTSLLSSLLCRSRAPSGQSKRGRLAGWCPSVQLP